MDRRVEASAKPRGDLSSKFNTARDTLIDVLAQVASQINAFEEIGTYNASNQELWATCAPFTAQPVQAPTVNHPSMPGQPPIPLETGRDLYKADAWTAVMPVPHDDSLTQEVDYHQKSNEPTPATPSKGAGAKGKGISSLELPGARLSGTKLAKGARASFLDAHLSRFSAGVDFPYPRASVVTQAKHGISMVPQSPVEQSNSLVGGAAADLKGKQISPPEATWNGANEIHGTSVATVPKFEERNSVDTMVNTKSATTLPRDNVVKRRRTMFVDKGKVKEDVKRTLMQAPYNVTNFYKNTGFPQMICRSKWFETCVLSTITINGLWLGVDTEYNEAAVIFDMHPVFVIADQIFCLFFFTELLLRFLSFELKSDCCKDIWFVFDSVLVSLMVSETWFLNLVLLLSGDLDAASQGILNNTSLLRLLRLLRMFRLARLAKLLRAMPEIMILIDGMIAAVRTVVFTFVLMFCLVYVFAAAFTTMAKESELGDAYFNSMYSSMFTLLVYGAFPDLNDPLKASLEEGFLYFLAFFTFGIVANISIMNMMVGVLVDVVNTTSAVEKESRDAEFLRDNLLKVIGDLHLCDTKDPSKILLEEEALLTILTTPLATQALMAVGVDVVAFLELLDFVFSSTSELTFVSFVETALQFRSNNTAMVKDIVDLRSYLKREMEVLYPLVLKDQQGPSHESFVECSTDVVGRGTTGTNYSDTRHQLSSVSSRQVAPAGE